jgi:predicted RNase H-like HicB family nuclease
MARMTRKRALKTDRFILTAVVWPEGKQFVSQCPELGVASCGNSPDDATSNLKEAVELYLENAAELGLLNELLPVLKASPRFTTTLSVESP